MEAYLSVSDTGILGERKSEFSEQEMIGSTPVGWENSDFLFLSMPVSQTEIKYHYHLFSRAQLFKARLS